MATPNLNPVSLSSVSILPATGNVLNVVSSLPFGVYSNSNSFITGAADQVAFTYQMLGGAVLDIELTEGQIYSSYEAAVLEYSYIINLHQAKNSLSSFLGSATGTFNSDGQIVSGSVSGSNAALKYPRFSLAYARRVADEIAYEAGLGGNVPFYTASVGLVANQQEYDLQGVISSSVAANGNVAYANAFNASTNRIRINKIWYKSPHQTWRFFGFYGGLNVVGNLHTYGQYSDNTTFEIVPVWQNKLQSIMYETSLYTRASHYSYEIKNNKIRIYPPPSVDSLSIINTVWFEFSFDPEPITENSATGDSGGRTGISGVNNVNTLPFENIPFESINSIGQNWIKRFALAISKGILGQIRGKFGAIPIPGESVTLNSDQLLAQSTDEMEKLREELKTQLQEITYAKLIEQDANIIDNSVKVQTYIPRGIYVG